MCRYACFVAVCFIFLPSRHSAAAEVPKAAEILDRYAETQKKFKSHIVKALDVCTSSDRTGKHNSEEESEVRYDGKRFYLRRSNWGNFGPDRKTSKENPYYDTNLYDGKKTYYHSQTFNGKQPDKVCIDPEPGTRVEGIVHSSGDALQGKMYGDSQRIDAVFRDAGSTVRVREKPERVRDSDCYVIEAKTNRGKYTVWIDPEHGYNIAKAQVSKSGKDMFYAQHLDEVKTPYPNVRIVSTGEAIKDVRFEKIGELWIPMEGTIETAARFSDRTRFVMTLRHKRTEVIVNPDHDALGSFVPKFPNGSSVRIVGVPRVLYTWQDGKCVPK
jgi:hypothetical protein